MNTTTIHNGDLPKKFPNWHLLWCNFYEKGQKVNNNELCKYEERFIGGYFIHVFDAWYIKSKCFDEMKAEPFTFDDLINIECALANYQPFQFSPEIINRISALKTMYYESQYFGR